MTYKMPTSDNAKKFEEFTMQSLQCSKIQQQLEEYHSSPHTNQLVMTEAESQPTLI